MEEFRRLAFEGVADKLENPSYDEESERPPPETMGEESSDEDAKRNNDGRNAERVAEAVDPMLVAGRVLRDPLLAGASAKHAAEDDTTGPGWAETLMSPRASTGQGLFESWRIKGVQL